ncbi:MAG: toll/interleukin-1 receptor domain-containing protein [Thermoguttaceae bacterium]
MGPSENRILEEIRNWEKESMTGEHPMVFVSYSHDNDEHCSWVGALRDKLRADGVNAIIDESLPNGYPLNLFMEQILKSPQLKFVVCVCSALYAKKADSGTGGVGYEQAIMTRELTTSFGNNKIIPILRNNPDAYVPAFLGTKKYLDFRNDKDFDDAFFELTGDIFEIPRMPPLGPVPDWVRKRLAATSKDEEETIQMKLKNLSMAAGELIVAVLENSGAALKRSDGICVAANEKNSPFVSAIPQSERASDDEIVEELCDRGLLSPYVDKLFLATDKARKLAGALKRLDETRVFVYAPDLVKALFPTMSDEGATLRIQGWTNSCATIVAQSEKTIFTNSVKLRNVEIAVEYLYREKLIENLRFVDLKDRRLIGVRIGASFSIQASASFFAGAIPVRIAADFTERARRVAKIDLGKLNQTKTREA